MQGKDGGRARFSEATPSARRRSALLLSFGVVTGPCPVNHHDRLVSHDPRIVSRGKRGDLARPNIELRAIAHLYVKSARHMKLKMRSFAPLRLGDRLDMGDHLQPGSSVNLPTTPPPMWTSSTLPFSNLRTSSGALKPFLSEFAIAIILPLRIDSESEGEDIL